MGIILAILAASALIRAEPAVSPGGWVSDPDYPVGAKQRREEGTVGFSILITSEGRTANCFISKSSGFADLDKRTCDLMIVRSKFRSARDENGSPIADLFVGRATWRHPEKRYSRHWKSPPAEPDMILQVQKLPGGAQEEVALIVTRIDGSGHVVYCEADRNEKSLPQLVEVACSQVKAGYTSDIRDSEGKPIPMLRPFRIAFRTAPN